ncbi:MAG: methyltransferase domain-containing protein [Bacteroidota bacterium]
MNWRWQIAQWTERRWWQQYLRRQPVAEYLERKKAYWQRVLKQVEFFPVMNQRVLDAGCGPAGIFTIFPEHQVVAIDPLVEMYEQDLAHFERAWYPNVDFRVAKLEGFEAEYPFDIVFCLNAINHVADIRLAFQHLAKATKAGGTLLLSIDAHNYGVLKAIFQLLPGDVLHPHQYDLAEYQAMLEEHAFEVEATYCLKQQFIFNYYLIKAKKKRNY